ncbi:MAG: hypothetical protein HQ559_00665 [Lentisphaerae bacterium]|nr:hypothetical protein [Lentisphaerota bacterium]
MSGKRKATIAALLVLIVAAYGIYEAIRPLSAADVMAEFYSDEREVGEDMLMDPLILNAELVTPTVIEAIKDRDMHLRRYAISFLGIQRVRDALPALRSILADTSEIDYFRGDALGSIYQIDKAEGLALARKFNSGDSFLAYIARGLIDGSRRPFERTYQQALVGEHN